MCGTIETIGAPSLIAGNAGCEGKCSAEPREACPLLKMLSALQKPERPAIKPVASPQIAWPHRAAKRSKFVAERARRRASDVWLSPFDQSSFSIDLNQNAFPGLQANVSVSRFVERLPQF